MQKLSTNGYYLSDAIHYEDWHAGGKHEWWFYHAYHFKDDGTVVIASQKHQPNFVKADFLNKESDIVYKINGNILEIIRDQGGMFEVSSYFTVLGIDAIVRNTRDQKFRWTSWS